MPFGHTVLWLQTRARECSTRILARKDVIRPARLICFVLRDVENGAFYCYVRWFVWVCAWFDVSCLIPALFLLLLFLSSSSSSTSSSSSSLYEHSSSMSVDLPSHAANSSCEIDVSLGLSSVTGTLGANCFSIGSSLWSRGVRSGSILLGFYSFVIFGGCIVICM